MKRALLLTALLLVLLSSAGWALTRTVTNCADDGVGSLRYALASAEASDVIVFDITTNEAGYSAGATSFGLVSTEAGSNTWFRVMVNSALPLINDNNLVIRGSTQTREASNSLGPEVEVRANGTFDLFYIPFGGGSGTGDQLQGLYL